MKVAMPKFKFHPISRSDLDQILDFSKNHVIKPIWSPEHIKEFVLNLTSSEQLLLDLHDADKRIAFAVLVDKIQNKGNNACLEILGLDKNCDLSSIYSHFIHKSTQVLAKNRSGIELTVNDSFAKSEALLLKEGFQKYYETFEMQCKPDGKSTDSSSKDIFPLTEKDYEETYKVVSDSFRESPDVCVPSFEDWKTAHKNSTNSKLWIYKAINILGILNTVYDPSRNFGEIRSVGILPGQRGKGIGRSLLRFALSLFAKQGLTKCHLTVSTTNLAALELYKSLGFEEVDHYQVYCKGGGR